MAGTAVINPIGVGLMGAILAAFALGRLAVLPHLTVWHHAVHLGLVALGGMNLLLGASRGPTLAFALCFVILIYTLSRGSIGEHRLTTRASTWIYAAVVVSGIIYIVSTQAESLYLVERLSMMFEDRATGGSEERDFIYAQAWQDFLNAPVFGSSYVVSIGSAYAHSFWLDALMSTGLVGAAFFVPAMFWALLGLWRLLNGAGGAHGFSLALAGLCFLVVGTTSGSVGQTPELWLFLTLATVVGNWVPRGEAQALAPGAAFAPRGHPVPLARLVDHR